MNEELGKDVEDAVVAHSKALPGICLEEQRNRCHCRLSWGRNSDPGHSEYEAIPNIHFCSGFPTTTDLIIFFSKMFVTVVGPFYQQYIV